MENEKVRKNQKNNILLLYSGKKPDFFTGKRRLSVLRICFVAFPLSLEPFHLRHFYRKFLAFFEGRKNHIFYYLFSYSRCICTHTTKFIFGEKIYISSIFPQFLSMRFYFRITYTVKDYNRRFGKCGSTPTVFIKE